MNNAMGAAPEDAVVEDAPEDPRIEPGTSSGESMKKSRVRP